MQWDKSNVIEIHSIIYIIEFLLHCFYLSTFYFLLYRNNKRQVYLFDLWLYIHNIKMQSAFKKDKIIQKSVRMFLKMFCNGIYLIKSLHQIKMIHSLRNNDRANFTILKVATIFHMSHMNSIFRGVLYLLRLIFMIF